MATQISELVVVVDTTPVDSRRVFEPAQMSALGRYHTLAVAALIIGSNLVQMISNIIGICGGLEISAKLGIEEIEKANWIAASYPLTQGTFVLVSGRLGSVYGHNKTMIAGVIWFTIWSIVNAFCPNFFAFNIVRGLSGIGGALIMPNAVAMIGVTIPPGKMRNLCLGLFAASAPVGGYLGAIITGLFLKYSEWKWIFICVGVMSGALIIPLIFLLPPEQPIDRHGSIDWIGAALGIGGLVAFNFVWNQAPAVGWSTPYEIALLFVAIILIILFVIWESRFTKTPIMPLDVWKAPSFAAVILVVLLSYMAWGTLSWYSVAWQQRLRHWSVLAFAVGWTPFVIFSTLGAALAAWLIPRVDAQWILALGAISVFIPSVMFATMPEQQSYWVQVFPATVIMSFCPDFIYTAAQIIACNSVPRRLQGVAASVIGTLNLYGGSLGLGFAGTIEVEVVKLAPRATVVNGYRAALYFGAALAGISLLLDAFFVRMVKDEREGWAEEDFFVHETEPVATATGTELNPNAA